jgi:EAL domain-containing protein (putative c-di-GMP-specific phosphodiesterase class I)/CheY-like chemotaxis protein
MNQGVELPTPVLGLPPRVLVLEDHALQRDILIVALRRAGVSHVWGAESVPAALELLQRSGNIDVVLSDLMMEGTDGVAFLTVLSQLPQPPAVILTSSLETSIVDSVEQMGRGLGLYMAGQLPKPATLDQVVARLRQALERPGATDTGLQLTELASLPDIRRGLAANEFVPHYQAKVSAADQRCLGVEISACWHHPELGFLPLTEFSPVLEHAGLDGVLIWQLLQHALVDVQNWARQGLMVPISINLSNHALRDASFPDRLHDVVSAAGFATEMLTLEIPSATALADRTTALQIAARLRMKGFGLALDNFGTGNMALELLAHFPFDELKIERQLLLGEPGEKAEILLGCLIEMGRKLAMRTVVEGIETASDLAVVQALKPDALQGNYITPALPAEGLLRWWSTARGI